MDKYYKIGEVAEEKGFSIDTLRYYDKIGLLKPAYTDPDTKYRYYTSNQFYKIEIIKHLKGLDVSNEDLLNLCNNSNPDTWDSYMSDLSNVLRKRIDSLFQSLAKIELMQKRFRYIKEVNMNEGIYYKYLDTRYVIERDCISKPATKETIEGFTMLYKEVAKYSLDNTFQSGSILSIDKENGTLDYSKIYVEFSNCPDFVTVPNHKILPAGMYICINNRITDAEEKSSFLLDYLKQTNVEPKLITEEYVFEDVVGYDNPCMAIQILIS